MKSFVVSGVGQVHRGLAGAVYHGAHSDAAVICGVNVDRLMVRASPGTPKEGSTARFD